MNHEFERAFSRDLELLIQEIKMCDEETELWFVPAGITNSIGHLSQHLIGNLNHFIGALIGETGYIRNRPAEFEERSLNKIELIEQLTITSKMVSEVLKSLNTQQLEQIYPTENFGYPMTINHMLLKLANHLGYHLGQINYLRRILQH
jgi:uncharacterized damage-inducible protein DinB